MEGEAICSSTWRECPSFHPDTIPTEYAELRQWRCGGDGGSEENLTQSGTRCTAVYLIFAVQSEILNPVSSGVHLIIGRSFVQVVVIAL